MLNPDWDIKPRGTCCTQCQEPFQDGQDYVSALTFDSEEYQRRDQCQKCWAVQPAERDSLVSVWKGTFRAPPPPAPDPLNRETVETTLRDLIARGQPELRNVIYILAVMLERRRILVEKEVQQRPNDLPLRVYEHRRTGDTFLIADPMLSLNQLEHVRREVMQLLDGSRTADEPPAPQPITEAAGAASEPIAASAVKDEPHAGLEDNRRHDH
ncbi:MAG: hypothetical protein ABR497_05485 [Kiritimatiellia bacterium]|nr:hypothetical protein [Lentisphaerota bacterium]